MRCTRRPMDATLACAYVVTYPTKCKQLRATFPRSALGGAYATIRSNECLGMGHRLRHRFIRNAEADTENYSVCMRWDVSLFCSARCCGRSEGIKATWCKSRVTGGCGYARSWIRTSENSPSTHLYRSGLLMSQRLHRLHPPRVSGELFEERGVFPVGCKRPGERLLH